MNYRSYLFIILTSILSLPLFAGCKENTNPMKDQISEQSSSESDNLATQVKITIGGKTFLATLLNNEAAKAYSEQLPMTINMAELNSNEKFFDLAKSLPTNASKPESIKAGDLMLYGSRTLVLFYKSFSTSYSYTKLGSINDPSGLAAALGSGSVVVTFELE